MNASPPAVAVFDFDGTLTRRDSLFPFLRALAGPVRFAWSLVLVSPVLVGYLFRLVRNDRAKEAVLTRFLRGRAVDDVDQAARRFAREGVPRLLRPEAVDRLRWHQARGDRTVLLSASPEAYLRPWAERMGFDEVLATRLETVNGTFTGRLNGPNCYGPEKVRRLQERVGEVAGRRVYAYGDSRGDRELLAAATQPFYRTFADAEPPTAQPDAPSAPGWERGLIWVAVLSAVLYLGLVLWSGAGDLAEALGRLPVWLLPVLLLPVLVGYGFRFARWQWYLRQLGHAVPAAASLRIFLSSFALTASPGKAGESVRSIELKRAHGVPITAALAGLFAERFTDVLAVVSLILLGLYSLSAGRELVIGVGVLQLGVLSLLQRADGVERWTSARTARWERVRTVVQRVGAVIRQAGILLRPRPAAAGTALGAAAWVLEGLALYALFLYLGADVAWHEAVLIHSAATLFGALTLLPGGVGGHEAVAISLSVVYGATPVEATTATLLIRLLTLWFAVGLGAGVMAASRAARPAYAG